MYLFWQWVKQPVKDELVRGPIHVPILTKYSQRRIILCLLAYPATAALRSSSAITLKREGKTKKTVLSAVILTIK